MPTLVVLAAGLGSRYGAFKQVDRVGPSGETLLEYGIFDARRAGFRRIVFVIRRELEQAFATLAKQLPGDIPVACAYQDTGPLPSELVSPAREKPWGTVHAVLSADADVREPFAVINADDFYGVDAYVIGRIACEAAARDDTYAVIGLPLGKTLSKHGPVVRAICRVQDGWIADLEEVYDIRRTNGAIDGATANARRVLNGRELASMNFWVFAPSIFGKLSAWFDTFLRARHDDPSAEAPLPEAINDLIQQGTARLRGLEAPGPWFGLTHADDRDSVAAGLRDLHERGIYPTPLWS